MQRQSDHALQDSSSLIAVRTAHEAKHPRVEGVQREKESQFTKLSKCCLNQTRAGKALRIAQYGTLQNLLKEMRSIYVLNFQADVREKTRLCNTASLKRVAKPDKIALPLTPVERSHRNLLPRTLEKEEFLRLIRSRWSARSQFHFAWSG